MLVDQAAHDPPPGLVGRVTCRMAAPMYMKQLEVGPMQNYAYLIGDAETKDAAVIDAGWDLPAILTTLERDGYRLTRAFVTHHHFDHVMGLADLLKAAEIPVHIHEADAPMVSVPASYVEPTRDGQVVMVGRVPVTVLHTPGHTPGSQCLLADGHLFSGDTLFIGACGRWDLPGGDPRVLHESLAGKLRPLPDDTVLCPGHNYAEVPTTSLGEEKRTNPFLRVNSTDEFLRLIGRA